MSQGLARASQWLYQGIWGVLVKWFRVPAEPPTLPSAAAESPQSIRPADGFLRYLKFQFWLVVTVIDVALLVVWLVLFIALPLVGVLVTPLALAVIIVPDILAYVAIHLRYDTTWYVVSDRSLRIRRGIWIIHETTITYENIQNVSVSQGPLQRWFGIADVIVQTAGGGGGRQSGQEGADLLGGHHGLIEGVDIAPQIRDLIMNRLNRSTSAGLGDERHPAATAAWSGLRGEHIIALREIRDAVLSLTRSA
jgi:membrane protein YdbS with pleckstrin-like domain